MHILAYNFHHLSLAQLWFATEATTIHLSAMKHARTTAELAMTVILSMGLVTVTPAGGERLVVNVSHLNVHISTYIHILLSIMCVYIFVYVCDCVGCPTMQLLDFSKWLHL